jgi:hypothetical protein
MRIGGLIRSILKYPSRSVIPAIGLLLTVLTAAAYAAPKVWIDRQSAEFGRVARGTTVSEIFLVRNLGDETLVFEDAQVSMPGMTIQVRQALEPGEEAELVVNWDTSNISQQVEGAVRLKLNDPARSRIFLSLSGTVFRPVDVLPYPLVMLSSFEGEQTTRVLEIVNNQESPLLISRLEPQGDAFVAEVVPVEAGQRYELRVTVKESTPVGRYEQFLVVHTTSSKRPKLGVQVRILVKPEVYAAPDSVEFGKLSLTALKKEGLAELLSQTLTLQRKSGTMSITSVTSDLSGLAIKVTPEGPAEVIRVDIRLDPKQVQAGPLDGNILIETDDENFPSLEIPVSGLVTD